MSSDAVPDLAINLRAAADYGQIYVYSPEVFQEASEDNDELYLDALDDAIASERFVGVADGLVDVRTASRYNPDVPMRVEVWSAEPPTTTSDWEQEVDVDLDVPDGKLVFEASGGGATVQADVPAGRYRARVSGRGYAAHAATGAETVDDEYLLQLWPRTADSEPDLRRSWSGMAS